MTVSYGDITISCYDALGGYLLLIEVCKEKRLDLFSNATESYVAGLHRCLEELEGQLPREVTSSSPYRHAKVDYNTRLGFVKAPMKPSLADVQKTHLLFELARSLWDSFKRLIHVVEHFDGHGQLTIMMPDGLSSSDASQHVGRGPDTAKKPLPSKMAESIKSVPHSLAEYFHKFSVSRPLKLKKDNPVSSASSSWLSHRSGSSTPSLNSCSPTLASEHSPRSLYSDLPSTKFGLRASHIFFTEASSLADRTCLGSSTTFDWAQYIPLLKDDGLILPVILRGCDDKETNNKKTLAVGTPRFVLRYILQNMHIPETGFLVDAFFLYFRKHITPTELFTLLTGWYDGSGVPSEARTYMQRQPPGSKCQAKTQIIQLLIHWLETYWMKKEDEDVRVPLQQFAHNVVTGDPDLRYDLGPMLAVSICRITPNRLTDRPKGFQAQVDRAEADQQMHPPTDFAKYMVEHIGGKVARSESLGGIGIHFFRQKGGVDELARGITVLESDYFHDTLNPPSSIVNWRKDGGKKAMKSWQDFYNSLTIWVVDCVINHSEEEDRVHAYEMMVDIAVYCKASRNFSAARNITHSLSAAPISRLVGTISRVSQYHRDQLAQLEKFFKDSKSYIFEIGQTRPAIPLPNILEYSVTRCDEEAKKILRDNQVNSQAWSLPHYMDMLFYERITRVVRGLENVYGTYSIVRQKPVLQWIEYGRRQFEQFSYKQNEETMYSLSCRLVPQTVAEKRKPLEAPSPGPHP
ncbi:ras guanine nucleotide exchange factor domain-containing protein [Cristinia sonorae]|uniref:Ras guanine nucleotide exchange factor domain-containing protein n=1 Tax=Cristinia sonorae TaxID=1940300 RepID=A0A8K0XSW3_9AGAR|nr:ras guanine nucleotide exchange factor domain-containing protein [Cristinia sonorae]